MTTLLDFTDTVVPSGKVKVPAPPASSPPAPVTVDGVEITEDAIRTEAQNHPAAAPKDALNDAARALVVRELLLAEIRAKEIAANPEAVGQGKRETDEDAAIRALLEQEVTSPSATIEDCQRYYAANTQKFRSESLYEVRHILCAAPVSDAKKRTEAKKEAEAIIKMLVEAPGRFAELAREYSACPSKMQDGSLGQLSKGSTVPEFETVMFALEAGQLSPAPVPTQFGFHVIQLDRIIDGKQYPFEMVQDRISAWLEASSWSRAVSQYVGILASKAKITGIVLNTADGPLVQ